MAVIIKQSRGTYASVSITASYFANRTHKATSSKTVTSHYRYGAVINTNRYCKGVGGEITVTEDKDLLVNIMLFNIQHDGPFLLKL
jgi:hypothetical protein